MQSEESAERRSDLLEPSQTIKPITLPKSGQSESEEHEEKEKAEEVEYQDLPSPFHGVIPVHACVLIVELVGLL